ncbi:MAG: hypothetical protein KDJ52_20920 [Anaerolineae bacterium]|nr:hypothetical protein [Anaerolineae bacterium]
MKRSPLRVGFFLGLLTVIPVLFLTYLGNRWADFPFVPFHLFDFATYILPPSVVDFGVETVVGIASLFNLNPLADVVKWVGHIMAIFAFACIGGVFGVISAVINSWTFVMKMPWIGLLFGVVELLPFAYVETYHGFPTSGSTVNLIWFTVIFASWGLILGWLLQEIARSEA